jgi:hypothetical protein
LANQKQSQKPEGPPANVKLAGEAEPLGAGPVTVGMNTIGELPDAVTQRAGFYFAEARQLVLLFPGHFKFIVDKG